MAAHAVPAPLSAPLAPPAAAGDSLWESQAGHEASVGTLVHAWLAQIGRDGLDAWPAEHLAANLARMRRQLTRVGVPDGTADAAAQDVLAALQASVRHERGRWLLSQGHARREWPLLDLAGKVSVIDLALDTDAGWLVVDYKTSVPRQHESGEAFTARMRLRHAEQLRRYVAQVAALDARPVKAALYFPRADIWIEF
ncbi:ATP-dependent DNA helicase pcrA [plant metagenome]